MRRSAGGLDRPLIRECDFTSIIFPEPARLLLLSLQPRHHRLFINAACRGATPLHDRGSLGLPHQCSRETLRVPAGVHEEAEVSALTCLHYGANVQEIVDLLGKKEVGRKELNDQLLSI